MPVEETLKRHSVLLIAAHPDDETIGAGGLLGRMREPAILHVTDGSPRNLADGRAAGYSTREDYAAARRRELWNAVALVPVPRERTRSLDIADQEASFRLAFLAERIASLLQELRPGAVLTHPYEGGHPDHDATAFAVHAACALVATPPVILEFTSYHAGPGDLPAMETGRFLPGQDSGEVIPLSTAERERKDSMLQCFGSQYHMLRNFPVLEERFREAPAYDFTQAPHAGRLFYENFDWGIDGARSRQLAEEALRSLGLTTVL
jgi:LmbE family N-acetylglucosaminyl deacetylase